MKLNQFKCIGTQLTSLDLSNIKHFGDDLIIKDNLNLQYISLKNGKIDFCIPRQNQGSEIFDCTSGGENWNSIIEISNNPAVQFMCVDDMGGYDEINERYISEAQFFQSLAPSVSSYCSLTPGGTYNTITGNIKFDVNSNGCNDNDPAAKSIKIVQNTDHSATIFTNQNGQYTTYVSSGNMILTPQLENPYYTVSPASYTSAFSGYENTATADFCIIPNGIHADLEVSVIPVNVARPGFDATYHVVYKNKGNQTLSGNVSLDFNDAVLDYLSANPSVNIQTANRLEWSFDSFAPFESRTIAVTLNINSPMETPAVNIDDILHFSATNCYQSGFHYCFRFGNNNIWKQFPVCGLSKSCKKHHQY